MDPLENDFLVGFSLLDSVIAVAGSTVIGRLIKAGCVDGNVVFVVGCFAVNRCKLNRRPGLVVGVMKGCLVVGLTVVNSFNLSKKLTFLVVGFLKISGL